MVITQHCKGREMIKSYFGYQELALADWIALVQSDALIDIQQSQPLAKVRLGSTHGQRGQYQVQAKPNE